MNTKELAAGRGITIEMRRHVEHEISHLAHAGCQLMFLLEYEITGTGTDDRWSPSTASDEGMNGNPS